MTLWIALYCLATGTKVVVTLLFIYNTNILVPLLTVNMKNCLTPKKQKMCDPILKKLSENATPL